MSPPLEEDGDCFSSMFTPSPPSAEEDGGCWALAAAEPAASPDYGSFGEGAKRERGLAKGEAARLLLRQLANVDTAEKGDAAVTPSVARRRGREARLLVLGVACLAAVLGGALWFGAHPEAETTEYEEGGTVGRGSEEVIRAGSSHAAAVDVAASVAGALLNRTLGNATGASLA